MKTDHDLESRVRLALHDALDREAGPDPTWAPSPAAQRVERDPRRRIRWPMRFLAVAALLAAVGGAALLAGALREPTAYANGWVAFTVEDEDPAGGGPDIDIWFTALDQEPRRVVGAASDSVDQVCPAFSPDGHSLAYGSIEGIGSGPPQPGGRANYQNSALVIADVADDGTVADRLTIDVGEGLPPACALWSPDGEQLAFAVPLTSPINPTRSGEGSAVWIVRPADGAITVIPDLLATDLEWSPDGSELAIVGGVETASGAGVTDGLQDARIHLYALSSGALRTLDDTLGASALTWSPRGGRIAYQRNGLWAQAYDGLWVIDVQTGEQEILARDSAPYAPPGGYFGPVWSSDGETIARGRLIGGSGERQEIVLVRPDDRSEQTGLAREVVLPQVRTTTDGSSFELYPRRYSWSPDGSYLLTLGWTYPENGSEETWVVAVPTDPDAPAVVLGTDMGGTGIGVYDYADDTVGVPIQVWQRLPANAPMPSESASPDEPALGTTGWIAYTAAQPAPDGYDQDIWFASLNQAPRRVLGTDTDTINELCPAFSPDGRQLAYGRVTGHATEYFVTSDGTEGSHPATYQGATLVVADVGNDGYVTDQFTIDVGDDLPPPCPLWSPDGTRIAFGVPLTSPINPTRSAKGSEVWILTLADHGVTALPDLLATDLEFSPDGSILGIASGTDLDPAGGRLTDGRVLLYDLGSGATRTLEGTLGATDFTWAPDGGRIAYMTGDFGHELRVIDLASEEQRDLSAPFEANHGIGPVWSPDGESIVYQRLVSGEGHDVVLVWPDDLSADGTPREEVMHLTDPGADADGSDLWLKPYWVTWSPDGKYLLFPGWSSQVDPFLGVVLASSGSVPDILVNYQPDASPVYDGGPFVPIQAWGRLPSD